MPADITNTNLGKVMTVQNVCAAAIFVFGLGGVWVGLTGKVEANAIADKKILIKQSEFQADINEIKTSQAVTSSKVENIENNQERQQQDINYLKAQSDEIKTLLIKINQEL